MTLSNITSELHNNKALISFSSSVPDSGRVAAATGTNASAAIQRPHYTGLLNATSVIWRTEGVKGFYKGVTPNLWGAGTAWGLYFFL